MSKENPTIIKRKTRKPPFTVLFQCDHCGTRWTDGGTYTTMQSRRLAQGMETCPACQDQYSQTVVRNTFWQRMFMRMNLFTNGDISGWWTVFYFLVALVIALAALALLAGVMSAVIVVVILAIIPVFSAFLIVVVD